MKTTLSIALVAAASLLASGALAATKPASAAYTGHEIAVGWRQALTLRVGRGSPGFRTTAVLLLSASRT